MGSFCVGRRPWRAQTAAALVLAGLAWSASSALAEDASQGTTQPLAQNSAATATAPILMAATGATLPSLADIVQRVSPAVVSLTVKVSASSASRGGMISGSGFVIDPSGFIVTNNHVVANASEIEVRFSDGRRFKARTIGRDEATDVALIKIDGAPPLPSVRLGDDTKTRVGDWVLAVGNPYGLGGTVTAGILSARGRDEVGSGQFTDYLQLDAAINPGNSGGPTFDMSGRVIGMNTLGYVSPTGDRGMGLGFAIPVSTIRRVVDSIRTNGTVVRGFVGVQIESLSDDTSKALGLPNSNGALVSDVVSGSPAEKSGIRRGDVILKLNGATIKDNRDLSRRIAALNAGETATFVVWRDNRQVTVTVKVAKRDAIAENEFVPPQPDATPKAEVKMTSLGVALESLTPETRAAFSMLPDATGVMITHVDPKGDAAIQGLHPGDLILGVGTKDVTSLADVNLAVEQARSLNRSSVVVFVLNRMGVKTHLPIKLDEYAKPKAE